MAEPISIRGVSRRFGSQVALSALDLEVARRGVRGADRARPAAARRRLLRIVADLQIAQHGRGPHRCA